MISPLCISTIPFASVSPIPSPVFPGQSLGSNFAKQSKIISMFSSSIPGPRSFT